MSKHNGGYAFPNKDDFRERCNGMTLRDYASLKFIQGSLAGTPDLHLIPDRLIKDSFEFADAWLKARKS